MRSPGYALAITWVVEIWEALDPRLIARSFVHCGLVDYNRDDLNSALRHVLEEDHPLKHKREIISRMLLILY